MICQLKPAFVLNCSVFTASKVLSRGGRVDNMRGTQLLLLCAVYIRKLVNIEQFRLCSVLNIIYMITFTTALAEYGLSLTFHIGAFIFQEEKKSIGFQSIGPLGRCFL